MWKLTILLTVFGISLASDSIAHQVSSMVGRKQSVGVRGRLLCGTSPLAGAKVKLWDEDSGPDPDDLLGETLTNSSGFFEISGSAVELTNIDARLKIYHSCKVQGICKRKMTFVIPDTYITRGETLDKWFEFGSLNVEAGLRRESKQCF